MAMGQREERQRGMWIATTSLAKAPGHPFYRALNQLLARHGFDAFVEDRCRPYYAAVGRPSLAPGVYFRMLLIGYFEGIDSERGIAWRVADSMTLRAFLGYELSDATADHSTISRNRRLLPLELHQDVFSWILAVLAKEKLLKAKTLGIDATMLEANAAMRSIVRRDTGEGYREFLTHLAKASGIATPTRADLARLDRKRKAKGSNDDWHNPNDPDARITKMKDGRTHLAHKAEHAVDLETGAVVAVTLQPANRGDTQSVDATIEETAEALEAAQQDAEAAKRMSTSLMAEIVADRGYHSAAVLQARAEQGIRTYVSEPKRGRRRWKGKAEQQEATYANRRRVGGERGKKLARLRAEIAERSFAHCYGTGAMRRTHLRGHRNVLKRLLVHVGGFDLSLVMRKLLGVGTPRGLQGLSTTVFMAISLLRALWRHVRSALDSPTTAVTYSCRRLREHVGIRGFGSEAGYTTGC